MPKFAFSQERVRICLCNSPICFVFLKPSMVQVTLITPGVFLSFSQNKIIKIARFKGIKIPYKELVSHAILWVSARKTIGNSAASCQ